MRNSGTRSGCFAFVIDGIIGHRNQQEGKQGGRSQAENKRPGKSGKNRVQGNGKCTDGGCQCREQDGPHPDGPALENCLFQVHALIQGSLDKFNEHQGVSYDNAAQGNHADHGGGGEKNRIGKSVHRKGSHQVENKKPGHDAQQG